MFLDCNNSNILNNNERIFTNILINIFNCYFSRSNIFNGNGGIISILDINTNLTINYSTFYLCKCTSNGGAIFFQSYTFYSNCFILFVCSNECSCGSVANGEFSMLRINNSINNEIVINYLSITKSGNKINSHHPFLLSYGNQSVLNTNSSLNDCGYYSGFTIQYSLSFIGKFNTISNNKVNNYICLSFYSALNNNLIFFNNIINNRCDLESVFQF